MNTEPTRPERDQRVTIAVVIAVIIIAILVVVLLLNPGQQPPPADPNDLVPTEGVIDDAAGDVIEETPLDEAPVDEEAPADEEVPAGDEALETPTEEEAATG